MSYEYILLAAAIIIPLSLFNVFKSDHGSGIALADKKTSLPGAFGDMGSSKSKKKRSKKKNSSKGSSTAATQVNNSTAEQDQGSSESEAEEKVLAQVVKKSDSPATNSRKKKKGSVAAAGSAVNGDNSNSSSGTNKGSSASKAESVPSPATHSPTNSDSKDNSSNSNKPKPTSVESWKKQKQEQQREFLTKQQQPLQFASAAAKNSSLSSSPSSSPHIASIPGPGNMGNNSKKKNRSHAGSGLSHAEFPTLSRPEPAPAPAPKQPKPKKEKKEATRKPMPEPEPESEPESEAEVQVEENEEDEEEEVEHDEPQQPQDSDENEWTTIDSAQGRSGGIDFSKPMDPWVAQQQRQRLERVAVADPHGEQSSQFARVLSIKPTVKEERIREAIPDGFTTQKSRSAGSSVGSSSYQSAEMTKKQRENLAKAARKKEEKAAMESVQEQRRKEHMRQVKAEKMKEFYKAQTRKQQAPESRWDVPKDTAPSSSTVSGGMSSEVNHKGQLLSPMLIPRSVSRRKASAGAPHLPSLASVKSAQPLQATIFAAAIAIENTPTTDSSLPDRIQGSADSLLLAHRGQTEVIPGWKPSADEYAPMIQFAANQRLALGREPTSTILESKATDITSTQNAVHGPFQPTSSEFSSAETSVSMQRLQVPNSNARMIALVTAYRDSPQTASMTSQDVQKLYDRLGIHAQGKRIPKPITTFEDCNLPAKMLSNLMENGYTSPRGIQMQAIPTGLHGRDMIISAETGAGKTAGFLIPILVHVFGLSQSPSDSMQGPFALVLVPTRELAIQVEQAAKVMVRGMPNMRTSLLVGGQVMANQIHRLKQNIQVAVATPGRILDIFAKHPEIGFSNVFCLVLDEVDMMFSLGFGKQVKRILEVLPVPPNGRQTIVCSATLSRQTQQLTEKYLENALRIRIGNAIENAVKSTQSELKISDIFSPSSKIKQTILWVENDSKKKKLFSLLNDPAYFRPPVLVFVESRLGADLLAMAIQAKCPGIIAVSIHGEKSQDERSKTLESIVNGDVPVIVATGLLARGLNLNVATVINFDMAPSIREYVHRVGRAIPEVASKVAATIRKGPKLGGMAWAITFINNDHRSILSEFANMLHKLDFGRVTPLPQQLKQLIVHDTTRYTPSATSVNRTIGSKIVPMHANVSRGLKRQSPHTNHRPKKQNKN
ncbi:DEAD (Asp-Glu-Ala-Asp) box polypeptide 59 [Mortierella polycephala]|uniref:RNA helicase n=1 Tax=Mortierella polycephala TaxID=41804 RepID=A0A9P6PRT0_9FUNG|nr:DEAD (Asp-Glu-Ala-Asp) box polypeptide 59 [Mortierella polycephala]